MFVMVIMLWRKKLVLCLNEVFNLSDTEREESGKIMISLSKEQMAKAINDIAQVMLIE